MGVRFIWRSFHSSDKSSCYASLHLYSAAGQFISIKVGKIKILKRLKYTKKWLVSKTLGHIGRWKVIDEVRKPLSFINGETLEHTTSSSRVSVTPGIKLGCHTNHECKSIFFLILSVSCVCSAPQACLTFCHPMPPDRLLYPLNFPGKNTGVGSSTGDLPHPGIKSASPALKEDSLPCEPPVS